MARKRRSPSPMFAVFIYLAPSPSLPELDGGRTTKRFLSLSPSLLPSISFSAASWLPSPLSLTSPSLGGHRQQQLPTLVLLVQTLPRPIWSYCPFPPPPPPPRVTKGKPKPSRPTDRRAGKEGRALISRPRSHAETLGEFPRYMGYYWPSESQEPMYQHYCSALVSNPRVNAGSLP